MKLKKNASVNMANTEEYKRYFLTDIFKKNYFKQDKYTNEIGIKNR